MLVPGRGPGIACPQLPGFIRLHTEIATLEPVGPESDGISRGWCSRVFAGMTLLSRLEMEEGGQQEKTLRHCPDLCFHQEGPSGRQSWGQGVALGRRWVHSFWLPLSH